MMDKRELFIISVAALAIVLDTRQKDTKVARTIIAAYEQAENLPDMDSSEEMNDTVEGFVGWIYELPGFAKKPDWVID